MNENEKKFASNVIKAFLRKYSLKNNDDYEFNLDKCDKMNNIIAYCQQLETEYDCEIIRCMLEPKYEQGYIQVLFKSEFAIGEKADSLKDFINAISLCDGINITTNPADEEFFQITFFVENLWIPKKSK